MKSKCVVFPEPWKVDIIEEEIPALKDDQILLKMDHSLISVGTELQCLRGIRDEGTFWSDWLQYPFMPGYSAAATVVDIGKGVKDIKVGDRFATQATHRDYFVDSVNDRFLCPIPDAVSSADAAWQILGIICQLSVRRAELKLGESVGIIGAGTLGQLVIQYVKMLGPRKLVVFDTNQSRLDLAKLNGATHVYNGDVTDSLPYIMDITGGRKLDCVFDITGAAKVLAFATTMVRELGRVILLGDCVNPSQQSIGPRVLADSIAIMGMFGGRCPEHYDVANPWTWKEMGSLFFDYVMDGRMNVERLTTHTFSAKEAEKVYNWLLSDIHDTVGTEFDWTL